MRPVVHPVSGFFSDAESFTHGTTAPQWVNAPGPPQPDAERKNSSL
jgi:hypothetical protein